MDDHITELARSTLASVDALLGEIAALNEAYGARRAAATRLERRDLPVDLPGLNDLTASSKGLRNPLEKVVRSRTGGDGPARGKGKHGAGNGEGPKGEDGDGDDEQRREERDRKDMIVLSSVANHPGPQRWDAIKRCRGLAALRRQFPLSDNNNGGGGKPGARPRLSPTVDAVVDNGAEWLKVCIFTERKLMRQMAEEGWHPDDSDDDSSAGSDDSGAGDDEDGDDADAGSLLGMANQLVKAARLNLCRGRPPRVRIFLPNVTEGSVPEIDKLLDKVRRAGAPKARGRDRGKGSRRKAVEVVVEGATGEFAQKPVPPLETALGQLLQSDARAAAEGLMTATLNVELTLLISLVSDITHGRIAVQPWFGTQVVSHIRDEEHAPGVRLADLYAAVAGRRLVCTREVADEFSSVIADLGTPTTRERAAILLGRTGPEWVDNGAADGGATGTGSVSSDSQDLRSRFLELSVYPVPEGLQLPIQVVSDEEFHASRENVEALIRAGELPAAARRVFDKLDRQYHRSCYLYGWARGLTTVSANSLTVQQIYAVASEPAGDDEDVDEGAGGKEVPDMFCTPLAIGLNTVRPCPEERWNGLKDAKHGRRDAREKEAKAMKKAGAWGPALGVRSK